MNLTNALRDAFIKSVMNDVPRIDYDEQAHKILRATLREVMPPKLRAAYDDKELRQFLCTTSFWMPSNIGSVEAVAGHVSDWPDFQVRFPEATARIDEIDEIAFEQKNRRRELRAQLKAVAYGCTTDGALREALPEFAKYLPTEPPPSANLPAVAKVVADFVKAGWPKGKVAEVVS